MKTYLVDDIDDVKQLVAMVDDINLPINNTGTTLFHYICGRTTDVECIAYLLEHGANPLARDKKGWTPCAYLLAYNNNQLVRMLGWHLLKSFYTN